MNKAQSKSMTSFKKIAFGVINKTISVRIRYSVEVLLEIVRKSKLKAVGTYIF